MNLIFLLPLAYDTYFLIDSYSKLCLGKHCEMPCEKDNSTSDVPIKKLLIRATLVSNLKFYSKDNF